MEHVNRQNKRLRVAGPIAPAASPGSAGSRAVYYAATETTAIVALPDSKAANIVSLPGASESAGAIKRQVQTVDIGKWNQVPCAAANNSSHNNACPSSTCCDL
jgi:hypothetical protein